jgi:hypothetical protein
MKKNKMTGTYSKFGEVKMWIQDSGGENGRKEATSKIKALINLVFVLLTP